MSIISFSSEANAADSFSRISVAALRSASSVLMSPASLSISVSREAIVEDSS